MDIRSLRIMNTWSLIIMDIPTLIITRIWYLVWILARRLCLKLLPIVYKWIYLPLLLILETDKQRQLRAKRRGQIEQRTKRETFPFLNLPLELRIMIYDHAISDQEHNITDYKEGRLLPSLLHTNLQITREIYQFCPITTVMDVAIPNQILRLHPNSQHDEWRATKLAKEVQHHLHVGFYAHRTISRMIVASTAVKKFSGVEGRKGVVMKVRVKCLGCKGGCGGLIGGGQGGCKECCWFSKCEAWNLGSSRFSRKDLLFEFC
jgi:hypothetical protein